MRITCDAAVPLLTAAQPGATWADELLPGMSAFVLEETDDFYLVETDYRYRGYLRKRDSRPLKEEGLRSAICAAALAYLDTPYRWGGKSYEGIDCSGLTFMAYYQNGITIYRDAEMRDHFPIRSIPKENLRKGDLLYFQNHIALYLEHGRYIHASKSIGRVCFGSFYPGCPDFRSDLTEFICGSYF